MSKYKNGKVYIIKNKKNELVYIGSTIQSLSERMAKHRYDVKYDYMKKKLHKAMADIGVQEFYIERIEDFPCETKGELEKREGYYIQKFNSIENGYNELVAGRTRKQHYQDNKERLLTKWHNWNKENKEKRYKQQAIYRQTNRESIRLKDKAYRENNRDKIREKFECECGGRYTYDVKSRHLKSKKHQEFISTLK